MITLSAFLKYYEPNALAYAIKNLMIYTRKLPLALILLNLLASITEGVDNGMGITPPMGWNSWGSWGCNLTEGKIRNAVDSFVSTGLARKGYKFVNIDDCWQVFIE